MITLNLIADVCENHAPVSCTPPVCLPLCCSADTVAADLSPSVAE